MAASVIDYKATQVRRRFNLTNPTTIPHTTRLRLASIRLNTGLRTNITNNKVELLATVGIRGVTGIAQIRFRIFRDGVNIYSAQQGIESTGSEQNYDVTLQAIDAQVSGTHTYTLTAQNMTSGTTAQIVGPLNFSGLSLKVTM